MTIKTRRLLLHANALYLPRVHFRGAAVAGAADPLRTPDRERGDGAARGIEPGVLAAICIDRHDWRWRWARVGAPRLAALQFHAARKVDLQLA